MPLYMDRHEVPGSDPEQVAEAHARDLSLADKHTVQFLSYWFDDEAGQVFCLAKAPESKNVEAVHMESHGLIPHEIISVSTEVETPFRVILFTDLEGSTALLEASGEGEFMLLLTEHDLIIRRALVASRGREVKHTGDGIMASFDDASRALECAIAVQEGFDARTAAGDTPELRVRIGLAAGKPVQHNNDIFGSAVNLASRVCDAAEAGRILVTDTVRDLGIENGFSFVGAEERLLKGFVDPTRVFELLRSGD
jgi:class 3 adenylate cyclase